MANILATHLQSIPENINHREISVNIEALKLKISHVHFGNFRSINGFTNQRMLECADICKHAYSRDRWRWTGELPSGKLNF
jgi:hypothetical protein